MKKIMILCAIISLALMFVLGCASPSGKGGGAEPEKYSGFMELKAGQWAETVMKGSQGTVKMKVELIENSPDLAKYQVTTGEDEVSQIWYDKKSKQAVLYVLKSGDEVLCMNVAQAPTSYVTSDDSSYPADKPGVESDVYKTPTGKEISVAKFSGEANEVWVSSQVPFGVVKMIVNGNTKMQLYDFGTIGAKSLIEVSDVEHCGGSADDMGDAYVGEQYEDESDSDEEFIPADDYEYEEYIQEEMESDDSTMGARTYEAGTADDVEFDCSECYGMPPMAENACLASCR